MKNEIQKKKRKYFQEQNIQEPQTISKSITNFVIPELKEIDNRAEKIFELVITKSFPKLITNNKL